MKHLISALVLSVICLSTSLGELPEHLEELKGDYENRIKVWGVLDDDIEDENENEFFIIKFKSFQDYRASDLDYKMRVTVQLTDKKTKSVVFAQATKKPQLMSSSHYAGYTEWTFRVPYGKLNRPKLTAYAIEFGFMEDSFFLAVAVDFDDVDSAEEIMEGEGTEVKMMCSQSEHMIYSH